MSRAVPPTGGLPPGLVLRRPSLADAPALFELMAAHDEAVLGHADVTLADVENDLAEPGFDPGADAWLAQGPGGAVLGYAWAMARPSGTRVDVDVVLHPGAPDGLGPALLHLAEARALEASRGWGADRTTLTMGVLRDDRALAGVLRDARFAVGTTFHRLRRDLRPAVQVPVTPAGVTVRVARDREDRRTAHALYEAAFADHWGHVAEPAGEWLARLDARSDTDWSQLWLAHADGAPAGMLLATDQFVRDENAGYVSLLGVDERRRGRGLGRLLLLTAFAEHRRRGRIATLLGVDAGNRSGALRLYESVDMTPVLQTDVWEKAGAVPGDGAAGVACS